jgi:hypothetical protein
MLLLLIECIVDVALSPQKSEDEIAHLRREISNLRQENSRLKNSLKEVFDSWNSSIWDIEEECADALENTAVCCTEVGYCQAGYRYSDEGLRVKNFTAEIAKQLHKKKHAMLHDSNASLNE